MSSNQYIYIGLLALILLSYIDFSFLLKFFSRNIEVNKPSGKTDGLIEIVSKWDDFRSICIANNLNSAVEKLDEIFPMLIKSNSK